MSTMEYPAAGVRGGQPHVYGMKLTFKLVMLAVCCAGIAGGAYGVWYQVNANDVASEAGRYLSMAVAAALPLVGLGLAVYALTARLTLGNEGIIFSGFRNNKRMRYRDIAGYRMTTLKNTQIVTLFPKQKGGKPLKFSLNYKTDAYFDRWLASIPDLDSQDYQETVAEILHNPDFGGTVEERAAHLKRAHAIAWVLNGAGGLVSLWLLLAPDLVPEAYIWLIAALAAMPPLAVLAVILSKGLYTIADIPQKGAKDAQPNLALFFLVPAVAIAARSLMDIDLLDWQQAALYAVAGGLPVGIVAALVARSKQNHYSWIYLPVVACAWASAIVSNYDSLFDTAAPSVFQTQVLDRHKTTGKHESYHLKLGPWGPRTTAEDVSVAKGFYGMMSPGMTVCVQLHPGKLGVRWFEVLRCRR